MPGLLVLKRAFLNYVFHQSPNQAGHVAFSAVLAMFPLLLFVSSAASFLGEPGAAAELARTVAGFAPPAVSETLEPVIDEVLGGRSPAALTIGLFGTLWAASSGALAIRLALNRAYGVEQGLNFWQARLKVIAFTLIGTAVVIVAFSTVVVLPHLWTLLDRTIGMEEAGPWLWTSVRYGVAFVVLVALYAIFYQWLPDLPQRLRTVLPGAVFGAVMWLVAAALLSWLLRSAGRLTPVYGSFAGMVATLIFLYVNAATLIFGAEINGVLREDAEGDRTSGIGPDDGRSDPSASAAGSGRTEA